MHRFKEVIQKLGFQFGAVMVVVSTAPLVLASILLINVNRASVENATMELYSSKARMAALEVDNFVNDKISITNEIAAIFSFSDGSLTYADIEVIKNRFSSDPTIVTIGLFDNAGEEIFGLSTLGKGAEYGLIKIDSGYFAAALEGETSIYFNNEPDLRLVKL